MAAQQSTNSVFGQFKDRVTQAVNENADKPFVAGNQPIIPGITNGIARVTSCSFSKVEKAGDNKGKPIFMIYASVLEPAEIEYKGAAVMTRGMTTKQMVMFEEKNDDYGTKTFQSCAIDVQNILKGLGVKFKTGDDLEAVVAALNKVQKKPVFRVTTKVKQKKNKETGNWEDTDGVVEFWSGQNGLEGYVGPDEGSGVADSTASSNGTPRTAAARAAGGNGSTSAPATMVRRGSATPAAVPNWSADGADMDAMAKAAEGGDEAAQARFDDMAAELGIDLKEKPWIDYAWEDVPALLEELREKAAQGDPVDPEPVDQTPAAAPDAPLLVKGNVIGYKSSPRKRAVQVTVLKVYRNGTADVQENGGTKAIHKGVTESECEEAP